MTMNFTSPLLSLSIFSVLWLLSASAFSTCDFDTDDADGDEEETLSLGGDYKLAKSTKVYVFYTDNTDSSVGKEDKEDSTFGLGMEHKF